MRRFFVSDLDPESETVAVFGDEARHIKDVLRMKIGDELLIINGSGSEFKSEIIGFDNGTVRLRIKGISASDSEPCVRVTLFQCLPKQGKMETIIQKCVELGVYSVVPVVSKRCVVKPEGMANKLTRWNRVSQEAAKQCGRAYVPEITGVVEILSADLSDYDMILTAYEGERAVSIKDALVSAAEIKSIAVFIGPEGGFEKEEVDRLSEKGAKTVSLGRRILRTETAGMAVIAQIMYEFDL